LIIVPQTANNKCESIGPYFVSRGEFPNFDGVPYALADRFKKFAVLEFDTTPPEVEVPEPPPVPVTVKSAKKSKTPKRLNPFVIATTTSEEN
jgi:hypothetical protein